MSSQNIDPSKITFNADGSITYVTIALVAHVVVPGQGAISVTAGEAELIIPADPSAPLELVYQVGRDDNSALDSGPFPAVCEALAS